MLPNAQKQEKLPDSVNLHQSSRLKSLDVHSTTTSTKEAVKVLMQPTGRNSFGGELVWRYYDLLHTDHQEVYAPSEVTKCQKFLLVKIPECGRLGSAILCRSVLCSALCSLLGVQLHIWGCSQQQILFPNPSCYGDIDVRFVLCFT